MNVTKDQLSTFKRQAIGFIKWVNLDSEVDPESIVEDQETIRKAQNFSEIESVLKKHDIDNMFLSLVSDGYF